MEDPKEEVTSLPPGFCFRPTEGLVRHYLMRKVFNCVLSSSIHLENDNVFKSGPWDLPGGENKEEMYFFTTRKNTKIAIPKEKHLVGMRKTLVFYQGKPSNGFKTEWIMHEYCTVPAPTPAPTLSLAPVPQL